MNTLLLPLLLTLLIFSQAHKYSDAPPPSSPVCIIGAGIGGSSVAHFIRKYSPELTPTTKIRVFERNSIVGGRTATVTIAGETFEAGASILHPKNLHAVNYTKLLNLKAKEPSSGSFSLGIWDGDKFVFKTVEISSNLPLLEKFLELPFVENLVSLVNSGLMFVRYGFSLFKMQNFVQVPIYVRFNRIYFKLIIYLYIKANVCYCLDCCG